MKRLVLLAALLALVVASTAEADYEAQVVGGDVDREPDVQWIGAILYPGPGDRFQRQECGGSLVTRRYVLTAAHCIDGERPRTLEVLIGTKHLNTGGSVVGVAGGVTYPGYSLRTAYGDMALLKLERRVGYAPVKLVRSGTHYVGLTGYVAGWGSITAGGAYPLELRSAWIPIRPDSACADRRYVSPDYDGSVMICAGDGSADTCQGDSGGPLARRVNGRWRLVGVTSFGHPRCNGPGVYAWVGSRELRRWPLNRLGV